jgi:hypothetical protein
MRKVLQTVAPALLIGGLLAANLLPLGGTKDSRGPKQSDPPSETAQKPTDPPGQTAPTPTDPIPSPTPEPIYPELPGRLFLWLDGSVVILEHGSLNRIPVPAPFSIPDEGGFSPDGRQMAGFGWVDGRRFLLRSNLRPGEEPRPVAPVKDSGPVRWSPRGDELLTWSPPLLYVQSNTYQLKEFPFEQSIIDAVWSLDGYQVAVETGTDVGTVHLLDRRTWQVTALEGNLFDPVWVDKGLLYLNRAAPGQIFLRTPEGEERVHLDLDGLKKAKVTDLSYTEEASGLSAKPGELPTGLRLVALQSGASPDTPVFVFQVGETASRYGVGKVVDGAVHLWLFPVGTHSGPCRPFRLQDRLGGLFAGGIGRACQGFLVRLQFGLDHVQNLYGGSEVLIDTTGRWSVKRDGEQLLVMDLDRRIGHAYAIPGQPLHWHGQWP